MFITGKNGQVQQKMQQEADYEILKEALRQSLEGPYTFVDCSKLNQPELGELYNKVLEKILSENNTYAMRLNDALKLVGKSRTVEEILDSVEIQNESLDQMKSSSHQLGNAITNISNVVQGVSSYVNEAVDTSKESIDKMIVNMEHINKSCEDFNKVSQMIQVFKGDIVKINEIMTFVRSIANETNLLALNASIEAARAGESGKSFSVVAREIQKLAESTKKSTEEIESYVASLQSEMDRMVVTVEEMAKQISLGNEGVHQSVLGIEQIYNFIKTVDQDMNKINAEIGEQELAAGQFEERLEKVKQAADNLHENCNEAGAFMFQISRSADGVRGRIAKCSTRLSDEQWMEIFKVDHMIYVWRIFNHICGFEHLEKKNIENPNSCKLGKWYHTEKAKSYDEAALNQLKKEHELLHKLGVECFEAAEHGEREKAAEVLKKARECLSRLLQDIENLKRKNEQEKDILNDKK